jgi:hypothetical protein
MLPTASQSDTVKPVKPQSRRRRSFISGDEAQAGTPWMLL